MRRRQVVLVVVRSLGSAIVLVVLYYLLPLDRLASVPLALILAVGLLVLLSGLRGGVQYKDDSCCQEDKRAHLSKPAHNGAFALYKLES